MGRKKKAREEIKLEDIQDAAARKKFDEHHKRAKSAMEQRTKGHQAFSKISHMQNLYEDRGGVYSEGSTQAIKRKIRAQTIQRVPDGEIVTQFDKNSIEQVETEFIFEHKILQSEFDGKDMLKNLWRCFNAAYDYGFGCIRTGFETDTNDDIRISQTLIQWNDIWPDPDCKFIEEANWYLVREWISKADLEALIDESDKLVDESYNEDVVRYLIKNDARDGIDGLSLPLADKKNGKSTIESIEVWTLYERGCSTFETYVPSVEAVLRTVDNYDPRKDVPLHFMILEPDPEFPLGCSSVLYTLAQQQFADAFQTTAYQTLLLAAQPPLMTYGNLTPSKYKMRPRAVWPMGTNPNNKIEPFRVETSALNQYGNILQNVSSNMMKNLNVADGTIASDAHVAGWSNTPKGVESQRQDKTITINQYQKRVEVFFSEWANHALRSYFNAMDGEQEMTVDETTRRKVADIESSLMENDEKYESIINENKIMIDFSQLNADMLDFQVRTGSLIQSRQEEERKSIQELIVPISQMLPAVSDENKQLFEQNIMRLVARLCELSEVDMPVQLSTPINNKVMEVAIKAAIMKLQEHQQHLAQIEQQLMGGVQPQPGQEGMPPEMAGQQPQGMPPEAMGQGGMPPEAMGQLQGGMPPQQGLPAGMPPEAIGQPGAGVSAEFPPQSGRPI